MFTVCCSANSHSIQEKKDSFRLVLYFLKFFAVLHLLSNTTYPNPNPSKMTISQNVIYLVILFGLIRKYCRACKHRAKLIQGLHCFYAANQTENVAHNPQSMCYTTTWVALRLSRMCLPHLIACKSGDIQEFDAKLPLSHKNKACDK